MENFLTTKEKTELLSELRKEKSKRYADRLRVILLLDKGETISDISKFLFLDVGSVRNYKDRYIEGGIEKLINDNYLGRSSFLNSKETEKLKNLLRSEVYPTTQSIIDLVEFHFNVTYSVGGMTDLLNRIGFSYKKTKGVPAKADFSEQKKFINRFNAIKNRGCVYFGDSTHPMLNPILASGWIEKGKDFIVKTNSGKERLNLNGAIEINTLNVISRSCKTVNKDSMCELLKVIKSKNPFEKHLYLILDNASYNRAKKVQELAKNLGIKLIYLPPYSPNLNPIERLWKFVKKKVMANRYYEDLETFREEVMKFMRGIRKYRDELETLITTNFQLFE